MSNVDIYDQMLDELELDQLRSRRKVRPPRAANDVKGVRRMSRREWEKARDADRDTRRREELIDSVFNDLLVDVRQESGR